MHAHLVRWDLIKFMLSLADPGAGCLLLLPIADLCRVLKDNLLPLPQSGTENKRLVQCQLFGDHISQMLSQYPIFHPVSYSAPSALSRTFTEKRSFVTNTWLLLSILGLFFSQVSLRHVRQYVCSWQCWCILLVCLRWVGSTQMIFMYLGLSVKCSDHC